jgi:hypothetical protein
MMEGAMAISVEDGLGRSDERAYQLALAALNRLPDRCALDVSDLANRIGADKLELIRWVRADIKFARLIGSKVSK